MYEQIRRAKINAALLIEEHKKLHRYTAILARYPELGSHLIVRIRRATSYDYEYPPAMRPYAIVVRVMVSKRLAAKLSSIDFTSVKCDTSGETKVLRFTPGYDSASTKTPEFVVCGPQRRYGVYVRFSDRLQCAIFENREYLRLGLDVDMRGDVGVPGHGKLRDGFAIDPQPYVDKYGYDTVRFRINPPYCATYGGSFVKDDDGDENDKHCTGPRGVWASQVFGVSYVHRLVAAAVTADQKHFAVVSDPRATAAWYADVRPGVVAIHPFVTVDRLGLDTEDQLWTNEHVAQGRVYDVRNDTTSPIRPADKQVPDTFWIDSFGMRSLTAVTDMSRRARAVDRCNRTFALDGEWDAVVGLVADTVMDGVTASAAKLKSMLLDEVVTPALRTVIAVTATSRLNPVLLNALQRSIVLSRCIDMALTSVARVVIAPVTSALHFISNVILVLGIVDMGLNLFDPASVTGQLSQADLDALADANLAQNISLFGARNVELDLYMLAALLESTTTPTDDTQFLSLSSATAAVSARAASSFADTSPFSISAKDWVRLRLHDFEALVYTEYFMPFCTTRSARLPLPSRQLRRPYAARTVAAADLAWTLSLGFIFLAAAAVVVRHVSTKQSPVAGNKRK